MDQSLLHQMKLASSWYMDLYGAAKDMGISIVQGEITPETHQQQEALQRWVDAHPCPMGGCK